VLLAACGEAPGAGLQLDRPPEPARVSTSLRFEEAAEAMGLSARHVASRSSEKHMPEILGGGLAVTDIDRDGDPDVLLVNSGRLGAARRPDGAANRLFLNDGRGQFEDGTARWQLPSPGYGMGAAVGDVDADGWPDLFLTTCAGPDALLRNTGSQLVDVSQRSGLDTASGWSTSAAFCDLDRDGDLDLYVVRYVVYDSATALRCYDKRVHVYCSPVMHTALSDIVYRNQGDGRFVDVSAQLGLGAAAGKGLALAAGDLDGDGAVELYIANDTTPNTLWSSAEVGRLTDVAPLLGVAYSSLGQEQAGMGVDFSDVNGDGRLDILCTNFQGESTSVYCQDAAGFFQERSDQLGVGATSRHRLSFGIDAFDADNDGDEDLLVANGHIDDVVHMHRTGVRFGQRNTLYEQVAPGRLVDVTAGAGSALEDEGVSRGLVTSDLDGDGDLDFLIVDNDGPLRVGRNLSQPMGAWVGLWLECRDQRSAIGARVEARLGSRTITRLVLGANSYLSTPDARVHLGLGGATTDGALDELVIHWPGGGRSSYSGLQSGRYYHVIEGAAQPLPFVPGEAVRPPR